MPAATGTLEAGTTPADDCQPQESQTRRPTESQGDGDMVRAERQDPVPQVRRRRSPNATKRQTRPERHDPAADAGTAGTIAAIDHSGRFGTFPDPTEQSEELFLSNLGLARKVAWSWAGKTGLPYDDIEAIAMRGLLRGCRKYDATRLNPHNGQPYALSSLVCPFIHGELLHEFRDKPYAIRYPALWREKYGLVMRMIEANASNAEIAEAAGMVEHDVVAMVEAMCRPGELHDELHGADAPAVELDLLGPLMELLSLAWDDMQQPDQALILGWWDNSNRRTQYPAGAFQQLDKRLARMLNGRRLPQLRQLDLLKVPEVVIVQERKARRARAAVDLAGEQLSLMPLPN